MSISAIARSIDERLAADRDEIAKLEAARAALTKRRPGRPRRTAQVTRRVASARVKLPELDAHLKTRRAAA